MKLLDYIKLNLISLKREFWRNPNRLFAIRSTLSVGLLSIPFVLIGKPYFGVTLALGALAGALSETDDHPKGRLKALSITVISFFISSFSVGLLQGKPWIMGAGFVLSTIVFIVIGGIGERYRAITFGAILIGIYAMLGIEMSPKWYWPAILLPAGALFHGILTLILMFNKPWRLLDEQLAKGFLQLSKYLDKKAQLFPSTKEEQAMVNKDLAQLNIGVVNSLEKIKEVLNNYGREVKNQDVLAPYLQRFMLLQSLHERAASTPERYDKLVREKDSAEIIEGLGEMLRQLAYATKKLSENILIGIPYQHPPALEWISKALESNLQFIDNQVAQPLILLHHNLWRSHISLKYLDNTEKGSSIPRLRKDERNIKERIKAQLSFKHPRMRYAIRLSISFILGYSIAIAFNMHKGAWIVLTSLFVSQITYSDTRRRLFQRLMGTLTGVVSGILLLQLLPTVAGQIILMLGSAIAFFYWVRTRYSIAVVFITTFVLSAFSLISSKAGINLMIPRLIDTLIGASLSFLTIRFLWPGWQYKRMPELISMAMKKNAAYLNAILNQIQSSEGDDLTYRIARREAHLADNELAQAWNTMRIEPKSKRKLMQHALNLTYLNHALLSYISALSTHKTTMDTGIDIKQFTDQINIVLNQADNNLTNKEDISKLLMTLKQRISETKMAEQKQLLRLYYNIASSTSKIINEFTEHSIDN